MNGAKWAFGCVFVMLLAGLYFSQAVAQGPGSVPANPVASPPTNSLASEKSVLAESSPMKAESVSHDFCQCVEQGDEAAAARIERALDGPLHSDGLVVTDQPLNDVMHLIQDEYGISIQIDRTALEEAAIGTDAPVTISLHNVSLRSAFRIMLKQLSLTSVIQDEVLLITTNDAAEKDLKICVYDARKVLSDANEKNLKALVDTITSTVSTETWTENGGGQAEIRTLPPGLLVISQTQAVHQEIRNLLGTIRKLTGNRSLESKADPTLTR